jgi:hypothetical protein
VLGVQVMDLAKRVADHARGGEQGSHVPQVRAAVVGAHEFV